MTLGSCPPGVVSTNRPSPLPSAASGMLYRVRLERLTGDPIPPGRRLLFPARPSFVLTNASSLFSIVPGTVSDNGAVIAGLCGHTWLVQGAWGNAAGWSPYQAFGQVEYSGSVGKPCQEFPDGTSTCCTENPGLQYQCLPADFTADGDPLPSVCTLKPVRACPRAGGNTAAGRQRAAWPLRLPPA